MQTVEYSHRNGRKTLGESFSTQVRECVESVEFRAKKNCASKLRLAIIESLNQLGWSDQVQLDASRKITITGMLGRSALCLQTGNLSRFPYDLLKLQALFIDDKISGAFYILPTKECAKVMGENIANFERLTAELGQIFNKVITLPLVVIGFENKEQS